MSEDKWLKRFKEEILPMLEMEMRPEAIFVFGSRVSGTAREDSDIDVIIVSDYFEDIPFIKRMPTAMRIGRFEKHVDYICYTPKEFDDIKDKSSIIMDAMEYGIKVA